MPRLFTALEVPETVAAALALARGGVVGGRWIEPADYHITLRFVGDVERQAARDVAEALYGIRRPPVAVRFDGLSWFGGDKPRAIVARVRPDPALVELQAEQERRLRRIGLVRRPANSRPMSRSPACAGRGRRRSRTTSPPAARSPLRASPPIASCSTPRARASAAGPYVVEAAYPLG